MLSSSTHIVRTSTGGRLTAEEIARRRVVRAEENLALAEQVEELAETNIRRHGGPGYCSDQLVGRLMRAHERVFVAEIEKWRCEQQLAALNRNGGLL